MLWASESGRHAWSSYIRGNKTLRRVRVCGGERAQWMVPCGEVLTTPRAEHLVVAYLSCSTSAPRIDPSWGGPPGIVCAVSSPASAASQVTIGRAWPAAASPNFVSPTAVKCQQAEGKWGGRRSALTDEGAVRRPRPLPPPRRRFGCRCRHLHAGVDGALEDDEDAQEDLDDKDDNVTLLADGDGEEDDKMMR
ncbi:hypothetical protein C8F04DRAFT_1204053 [Mycena alexandri]|uniref:Uncharacterized protein n=1 Tax=Mycena alexandri TaxID=1745969 RepID=A0AAD6RWV2_9AGAR|nr:hypothetical protein C8F04DRAFT_1204053 [Mycena alexandri]